MSPTLTSLLKSVHILAMPYEGQIAYLKQIGVNEQGIDELALEFDDSIKALPGLIARGELSSEKAGCFELIDRALFDLSSSESCWSPEALRDDPRWQRVRTIAANCLGLEHS